MKKIEFVFNGSDIRKLLCPDKLGFVHGRVYVSESADGSLKLEDVFLTAYLTNATKGNADEGETISGNPCPPCAHVGDKLDTNDILKVLDSTDVNLI